jgi:hypothetical protein
MKPITIRIAGDGERFAGGFVVEQGGEHADALCWDEMLGQVIALTLHEPSIRRRLWTQGPGLYPMHPMIAKEESP